MSNYLVVRDQKNPHDDRNSDNALNLVTGLAPKGVVVMIGIRSFIDWSIKPRRKLRPSSDFFRQTLVWSAWLVLANRAQASFCLLMIGLFTVLRSTHSTFRSRHLFLVFHPKASIHKFPIPTRAMANDLKGPSPYEIERTSSPYPNPYEQSPRSKILSQRTSNYHSTSLRNLHSSTMVSATVNKTSLHPGGVQ